MTKKAAPKKKDDADDNSTEIIIIIEDPVTGEKIKYKVDPSVGKSIKKILDAIEGTTAGPKKSLPTAWDSACRV